MLEVYRMGGWGVLPTTVAGLLWLAAAVLYALRPERQRIPLLACLALLTLLCGCLGFLAGVTATLGAVAEQTQVPLRVVLADSLTGSVVNLTLAFALLTLGVIVVADGALKLWRAQHGNADG